MKKIIYVALALILIGAIGGLIVFKTTDLFQTNRADTQTKTASVNEIKKINVEASSLDVEIKKTNRDQLSAEVKGWGNKQMIQGVKLAINKKGDTVRVTAERNQSFFTFTIGWSKLVIEVPERQYNRIAVITRSGDLTAQNLQADQLSLTTRSGTITAEHNQSSGRFDIETSSGDVDLRDNQARDEASIKANSGDLNVSETETKSLILETGSGTIDVQQFRGSLTANANSGDITIRNDKISGSIDAQTGSGNVALHFTEEPESVSVNYYGGSGEGTVDLKGFLYKEKTEKRIIGQKGDGEYKIKVRTNSGDFSLK
ncbi:DUF4097 domain-containing protein [Sporolactobacillus shoreicorticis]|uniref:DUF4097 domain-containing protein n=1 Tax=Sporolactobacillus shoreicorticis TaxID=1923877 RepID=A0ABW5S2B0_9BACL|nr:DUF4097 family beta strand repeat-containing protein [Sporolactobacillus shoreicorticis]MCO7125825.1 DUF4097 domain-containing protein [Sporolactobacillus shoreicorticis]